VVAEVSVDVVVVVVVVVTLVREQPDKKSDIRTRTLIQRNGFLMNFTSLESSIYNIIPQLIGYENGFICPVIKKADF